MFPTTFVAILTRPFGNLNEMASSQRPGEITYYEELGVEETASPEEVRDAFRALARLLHPDQQSDPQLKQMAERQMRKLNRIYAVLSDGDRRAAYDETLHAPRHAAPIIVFSGADGNLKKLIVRLSAITGIVLGSALLIWFMATTGNDGRMQEAHASAGRNTAGAVDAGDQITRLRDQLRSAEAERDSALVQLQKIGGKAAVIEARQEAPAPAPAASQESAVNFAQFAGLWFFGKGNGSASPGGKSQYPPEYIQLNVSEQDGVLHGQYHSRYQVLDHAISPDVDFTFSGTPAGNALTSAWLGPGGARGQVTMKLVSAGIVDLAWSASELGSLQWLTNGDATLIRK
ncbi:MAG TPA: J domain-containing protein [Bryobacteraceae bacterium]|nr:J domain-containing protein [Bryobacteraceae bacterium]